MRCYSGNVALHLSSQARCEFDLLATSKPVAEDSVDSTLPFPLCSRIVRFHAVRPWRTEASRPDYLLAVSALLIRQQTW